MAKTLKRTIEGKRISVFAFREFWNGQISLADSKKERDARDTRDNNAETSSEEGLQASKELSRDGNLNGTHETTIGQDANDCPVCPVDQNSAGQQQDIKESILTNPSSSPVPCVPDVPLEKHFAQNTPLPNLLKVGNRVQYVGKNSSLARQYAGILEIQVILDLQIFGVASPSFGAAHTLNLLIHGAFVIYSDAAMKAQEQARKTLQTLHDIKNPKPRTVFIKNAIAQQVNQLVTKTEELQKQLEDRPYAKVDFGGTEIAERSHEVIDLPAASVGTIAEGRPRVNDWANKRGRKSKSSKELS